MAKPYYQQIVEDIRSRIAEGEWGPGDRLPTNRELRDQYRERLRSPTLATETLAHALRLLKDEGVLRGQQGLGVFVAGDPASPA